MAVTSGRQKRAELESKKRIKLVENNFLQEEQLSELSSPYFEKHLNRLLYSEFFY